MWSRSPNFQDDTPQTHHSCDHHHGWAKPSSGPPSRSLSSRHSGCSIVMGICYQCAATGLPGEQCTTCGSLFQAKRGTHPAGGAAKFQPHPQSHISHQVSAGPPALSARVELPCAPPSTRNAPPVHGVPNPPAYHHFPTQSAGYPNSVVSSMAAGGAGGFSGYHTAPNPVHTGHRSGSAPPHTMAGGAPQFPTPPPQSILSASTQQPNFKERVAAAVASALRNRASTPPAKVPD